LILVKIYFNLKAWFPNTLGGN